METLRRLGIQLDRIALCAYDISGKLGWGSAGMSIWGMPNCTNN